MNKTVNHDQGTTDYCGMCLSEILFGATVIVLYLAFRLRPDAWGIPHTHFVLAGAVPVFAIMQDHPLLVEFQRYVYIVYGTVRCCKIAYHKLIRRR